MSPESCGSMVVSSSNIYLYLSIYKELLILVCTSRHFRFTETGLDPRRNELMISNTIIYQAEETMKPNCFCLGIKQNKLAFLGEPFVFLKKWHFFVLLTINSKSIFCSKFSTWRKKQVGTQYSRSNIFTLCFTCILACSSGISLRPWNF